MLRNNLTEITKYKTGTGLLIENDGYISMQDEKNRPLMESIKKINESAFLAQKRQKQGVVICPQQEELTRLSKMNLN